MSLWSRWFKKTSAPAMASVLRETAAPEHPPAAVTLTQDASPTRNSSLAREAVQSVLPEQFSSGQAGSVELIDLSSAWFAVWRSSRPQAQSWLQTQLHTVDFQNWVLATLRAATATDMRHDLLDVWLQQPLSTDAQAVDKTGLVKELQLLFKHKDKSIYKRLKTVLTPPSVKANVEEPISSYVQSVQVSVLSPAPLVVDTTDYVGIAQWGQQSLNLYQAFSELQPQHLLPLRTWLQEQAELAARLQHLAQQQMVQQQIDQLSPEQARCLQIYQRIQQLVEAIERWLVCQPQLAEWIKILVQRMPAEALQDQKVPADRKASSDRQTPAVEKNPRHLHLVFDRVSQQEQLQQCQHILPQLQTCLTELAWPLAGDRLTLLAQAKKYLKLLPGFIETTAQNVAQAKLDWVVHWGQMEQALETGDLPAADQALRALHGLVSIVKVNQKQQQQMQQAVLRLAELKDWQGFAELPKKQQLVAAMQQLVDQPLAIEVQAARIKQLQAEWQSLNRQEHAHLWRQFQKLSDLAYAPCQVFYAQQKQQRLHNTQMRQALCEQMENYLANNPWQQADWVQVRATLQLAKQQWRAAFPVEKGGNRELSKRFEQVCQLVQAKLDQHYAEQAALRQQAQAARLAAAQKRQQQKQAQQLKQQQALEEQQKLAEKREAETALRRQIEQSYWQKLQGHLATFTQSVSTTTELRVVETGAPAAASYVDQGPVDQDQTMQLRRNLVVEMEIVAGLPSPDADHALRMQIQVARLAKNFQRARPELAAHHASVESWCALPPVADSAAEQRLLQRLLTAYQAYLTANHLVV